MMILNSKEETVKGKPGEPGPLIQASELRVWSGDGQKEGSHGGQCMLAAE